MLRMILAAAFVATTLPAGAQQNDKKLPPGYILFPNAQGQNVPIKHATNYAQCLHNGKALGYSAGDTTAYCRMHYSH